jgi:hypothetical protein
VGSQVQVPTTPARSYRNSVFLFDSPWSTCARVTHQLLQRWLLDKRRE